MGHNITHRLLDSIGGIESSLLEDLKFDPCANSAKRIETVVGGIVRCCEHPSIARIQEPIVRVAAATDLANRAFLVSMSRPENTVPGVEYAEYHLVIHPQIVSILTEGMYIEAIQNQNPEALDLYYNNKVTPEIMKAIAYLHDIGKWGIEGTSAEPFHLLNTFLKFTPLQYLGFKNHVVFSTEILRGIPDLRQSGLRDLVIDCIDSHHEWHNGMGYHKGLRETEIPFGARLIAIGDAGEACSRPYSGGQDIGGDERYSRLITGFGTRYSLELLPILNLCRQNNQEFYSRFGMPVQRAEELFVKEAYA